MIELKENATEIQLLKSNMVDMLQAFHIDDLSTEDGKLMEAFINDLDTYRDLIDQVIEYGVSGKYTEAKIIAPEIDTICLKIFDE